MRIPILSKSKKLEQGGTFASQISDRLKACDQMKAAIQSDAKQLQKQIPKKHAEASKLIDTLAAKLKKDPDNKQLQKDYAAAIRARDMYAHGNVMNEAILGNADQ